MKENKLSIVIDAPVEEVFEFTINPANTHKWIQHLEIEVTNEYPPRIGTIYRNRGEGNDWDEYTVTELVPNEVFELNSADKKYFVRYTYKPLSSSTCEMEYFEWMTEGELSNPFNQHILQLLKEKIEG